MIKLFRNWFRCYRVRKAGGLCKPFTFHYESGWIQTACLRCNRCETKQQVVYLAQGAEDEPSSSV